MNGWRELMLAKTHYEELEHGAEKLCERRERYEAMTPREKPEHRLDIQELIREVEEWLRGKRRDRKNKG